MKVEGGRCVALLEDDGRFRCSVYERRPQICRDFERGGDACLVDRGRARLTDV